MTQDNGTDGQDRESYSDCQDRDNYMVEPDIEVFYSHDDLTDDDGAALPAGWYWWSCFPGCLPDGPPMGPYPTEAEALADATDV